MESFKRNSRHYRRRNTAKDIVFPTQKTRVGEPLKRLLRKNKGKVPATRVEEKIVLKFGSFNVNGLDEATGSAIQDLLQERQFDVSVTSINRNANCIWTVLRSPQENSVLGDISRNLQWCHF